MDTIIEGGLIYLTLLAPPLVALAIRRRIPHRPTLGAWLVVGSVAVGIVASVAAVYRRHEQQQRRRFEHAIAAIDPIQCTKPPPPDREWRTLYEIRCAPDHREAYLQGTGEHRRLFIAVHARGDRLVASWLPTEPPGASKVYRVWLEDLTDQLIDTIRPGPSILTVVERPGLANVVKLVVTIDAMDATTPSGSVVAEAVLQPAK